MTAPAATTSTPSHPAGPPGLAASRPERLFDLIAIVVAASSVTAVLPAILPLFNGGGRLALLLASLIPAVVAAAPLRSVTVPARLAVYAAIGVVLVALLPGGALGALGSGGARLLTGSLPALASGPAFGIAVAFTYLAAVLAVELARPGRGVLGSLVPGAALLLAALLVGAGGLAQPRWDSALFVATAAVAVLAFQLRPVVAARRGGTRAPLARVPAAGPLVARRILAGVGVTAAVALLALPLAAALPGSHARHPYDLRSVVAPAPRPLDQISLLATYSATYDPAPHPVFRAQVTGANPQSLYWRLATFDTFDGSEWTSSVVYQRAGDRLPGGPHLAVRTEVVHASLEPTGLSGYLPAPDRPEEVSVPGLGVAASDGELAIPAGAHLPPRLDVTSVVPDPAPSQLQEAAIPAGPVNAGAPTMPAAITSLARSLAASARPYPFARLTALSDYLTGPQFRLHPAGDSPIGAGYYQIDQLLLTHDGSSEQYAAAFAVLARAMGFHTRLAVGYTGGTLTGSSVTVTTRDLKVWPEVELSGMGWLPFPADPSGAPTSGARPASPVTTPLSQALQNQRTINRAPAPAPGPLGHSGSGPAGRARAPGLPWWSWAVAGMAAALVLAAGAVLAAKWARRRRQRAPGGPPSARLVGAWEYALDRLAEHGLALPASLTAPEVADRAAARFEASATGMRVLAPAVDSVRYDRAGSVSAEGAERGWLAARQVGTALRAGASVGTRLRGALSVAPWGRGR